MEKNNRELRFDSEGRIYARMVCSYVEGGGGSAIPFGKRTSSTSSGSRTYTSSRLHRTSRNETWMCVSILHSSKHAECLHTHISFGIRQLYKIHRTLFFRLFKTYRGAKSGSRTLMRLRRLRNITLPNTRPSKMRITTRAVLYTYRAVTSEYNEILSHEISTSERTAVEDSLNEFTTH